MEYENPINLFYLVNMILTSFGAYVVREWGRGPYEAGVYRLDPPPPRPVVAGSFTRSRERSDLFGPDKP